MKIISLILGSLLLFVNLMTHAQGRAGYPKHIELNFLDKSRKVYVVEPVDWGVHVKLPLKYADFRFGDRRYVYVVAGNGEVTIGTAISIRIDETGLTINGTRLPSDVTSAVIEKDGSLKPGAFIRTFD